MWLKGFFLYWLIYLCWYFSLRLLLNWRFFTFWIHLRINNNFFDKNKIIKKNQININTIIIFLILFLLFFLFNQVTIATRVHKFLDKEKYIEKIYHTLIFALLLKFYFLIPWILIKILYHLFISKFFHPNDIYPLFLFLFFFKRNNKKIKNRNKDFIKSYVSRYILDNL